MRSSESVYSRKVHSGKSLISHKVEKTKSVVLYSDNNSLGLCCTFAATISLFDNNPGN